MKKLFSKLLNRETVLYLIFGVLTTLVDSVVFWIMNHRVLGIDYYVLNHTVAFVAAVLFAYFTNKIFVFESRDWSGSNLLRELATFFGGRILSFLLSTLILIAAEKLFHAADFELKITEGFTLNGLEITKYTIVTALNIVLNYVISKLLVFKKK